MGEILSVKQLPSGYWHIRGHGPCNWAQPKKWPGDPADVAESFFVEASQNFRVAVMERNRELLTRSGVLVEPAQ